MTPQQERKNDMVPIELLERLRHLANAASPGPWESHKPNHSLDGLPFVNNAGDTFAARIRGIDDKGSAAQLQADADYIAATSPDVMLQLLDFIDRLMSIAALGISATIIDKLSRGEIPDAEQLGEEIQQGIIAGLKTVGSRSHKGKKH